MINYIDYLNFNYKLLLSIISIDLKKAFDTINHDILLNNLYIYMVSEVSLCHYNYKYIKLIQILQNKFIRVIHKLDNKTILIIIYNLKI